MPNCASPVLSTLLGLTLLAACTSPPLTPEERRALEIDTYCRGIAEDERSKHLAKREQSQTDEIGENDEVWEEATEGSDLSTHYQAAYSECMKENRPESGS
jgi:hypothetical protein